MRQFLDDHLLDNKVPPRVSGPRKGIGVIGLHEGRTLLTSLGRTTLAFPAAGCDLDEQKIESLRKEFPDLFYTRNYASMLARKEVEVVVIYTPDALHGQHIVQALEAGKDVICTKPLVNSMDDARNVVQALRATGRKLMVGQSTRFFEPFRRQRRAFDGGDVGTLELADAHYIHRMDWYYEKSSWTITDTDWVFLGLSHPVDLLRWYLGRIVSVQATAYTSALGKRYGLKGNDMYTVNLRSAAGPIGRALGHYGLVELPSARNCIELMLYGTRGTNLAQYHDMRFRHTAPDGTEVTEDSLYAYRHYYFNSEIHGMHYGEFANYTDAFIEALLTGDPYSPNGEEGIETFCVMEAIRRSAKEGKTVEVGPILKEAGLG